MSIAYANRLLSKVEVEKSVTTHIFRHTFITRMVENNIPSKLIAEHVGHSTTEMIDRIYSYFIDKMDNDLKQAINTVSI